MYLDALKRKIRKNVIVVKSLRDSYFFYKFLAPTYFSAKFVAVKKRHKKKYRMNEGQT